MKRIAKALKALIPDLEDVLGFGGVASMAYGAWLIYEPAGFLVGGALALGVVGLRARAAAVQHRR